MKFGFDVHGVVDTHCDIYATITAALVAAGHEVHVITGAVMSPELEGILKDSGVTYTHFFSIAQFHMDKGDDEVWNRTKADYCHREAINVLIDDSPVYGQFFDKDTIYLLQKDPRRSDFWKMLAELLPRFRSRPE